MSVTSQSGRGSKMKIEQVMRPEEAELISRVVVILMPDAPDDAPRPDETYVSGVTLTLKDGEGICSGYRYKVTVERIEDAEER